MRADSLTHFMCAAVGAPFTTWENRKFVLLHKDGKMYDIKNVFEVKNVPNMIVLDCGDEIPWKELEEGYAI